MAEDFEGDTGNGKPAVKAHLSTAIRLLLQDWYHWNEPSKTDIPRTALFMDSISAGVTYRIPARSVRDSHVMFRMKGDLHRNHWQAGSVTSIFQIEGKPQTTFLVVEPFKPASLESGHPSVFHRSSEFSFVTGYLFFERERLPRVLITLDQAIGHFAYAKGEFLSDSKPLFQALPLEKVKH